MVRSMTAAVSGLRTHQTRLDVIGNNIANVNTYGFKSSRVAFRDSLYQSVGAAANPSNLYGGINSKQIGYGTTIGSIDVMFVTGAYAPTDFERDLMINGDGFFIVGPRAATGSTDVAVGDVDKLYLTRVGAFDFDGKGFLVDPNSGYHVYGYRNTAAAGADPVYDTTKLVPIQIPLDAGGNPIELEQLRIEPDGTISGLLNGDTITVGKIALANVTNPSGLENASNSMYKARANTGTISVGAPGENATGVLLTGGLEMSTVDLSREFTDMITTQRGFQANSRIITVTDDMLQELVNLKR